MQILHWSISKLVPYRLSLRKNDHAVERMVASINEFGFKIPILARSSGETVDGHLRLKAAQKLGLSEVPVILCDEWTEAQVKAFRLMVNRSASWADWDTDLVKLELGELKSLDFDLNLTGFDTLEIDEFLFGDSAEKPEEVPEPPAEPVSRPGDLWVLGKHKVLCGDATSAEVVNRLVGVDRPVLMVTDPPYGVDYDPRWRERAGLGRQRQTGTVANDDRVDWLAAYGLLPGDAAYVWHAGVHAAEVAATLESAGFRIRAQIIWAKQHFALSRGDYHWQHEPCWYAVREGKPSRWSGDRTQSTLWNVANLNPVGGSSEEGAKDLQMHLKGFFRTSSIAFPSPFPASPITRGVALWHLSAPTTTAVLSKPMGNRTFGSKGGLTTGTCCQFVGPCHRMGQLSRQDPEEVARAGPNLELTVRHIQDSVATCRSKPGV